MLTLSQFPEKLFRMIEDSNTAALEDESYDEEKEFLFESTQISLRPKTKNSFRSRLQGLRGILECAMLGVIALLLSMILRNAEASSLLTYGPTSRCDLRILPR